MYRICLLIAVVTAMILPCHADQNPGADWNISIVPAELNTDRTVKLLADEAQAIYIMPQIRKELYDASDSHDVTVEINVPAAVELLDQAGTFTLRQGVEVKSIGQIRSIITMLVTVRNPWLCTMGRLSSEWKGQTLLVRAPAGIDCDQNWITVTVIDTAGNRYSNRYDLVVMPMEKPGAQIKTLRVGLWTYGMRSISDNGCEPLAAFLQKAGVNYLHSAGAQALSKALKAHDIIDGGAVHHSAFVDRDFPNQNADVSKPASMNMSFACPSVVHHRQGQEAVGVDNLVKAAQSRHGHATVDYEPGVNICFCDECVASFKAFSGVNDEQVAKLRTALVTMSQFDRLYSNDAELMNLQTKWVAFRSQATAEYVGLLAKGFKAKYPEGIFELTSFKTYRPDDRLALWYGVDAAAMAKYLDVVQPQIYEGYGSADAKLAINIAAQWRKRFDREGWACKLCPILLVRYAGATVYNNPDRVAAQIIGTIAEGADGVVLYYPELMDAPYWTMLAEVTGQLEQFESYYTQGKRVDDLFPPVSMDEGTAIAKPYSHRTVVENPSWHFTAHEYKDNVLLTLQNLHEANDVWFRFDMPGGNDTWKTEEMVDAPAYNGGWLMPPQKTGFVILKKNETQTPAAE